MSTWDGDWGSRTSRRTVLTPLEGGCGTGRPAARVCAGLSGALPSGESSSDDAPSDESEKRTGRAQVAAVCADDGITERSDAELSGHIHASKKTHGIWPLTPKLGVVERMLFIAVGIALALVAADLLDVTRIRKRL